VIIEEVEAGSTLEGGRDCGRLDDIRKMRILYDFVIHKVKETRGNINLPRDPSAMQGLETRLQL